jgi:hypothetical protein
MNDDFDRPVAADRQVETWLRLFGAYRSVDGRLDPANPAHLRELAGAGLSIVYLDNHPTAQDALRAHSGKRLKGSTRKRLRFLARLERRADALEDSWRLRWAQMQAKSRLAYLVDPDRLDDLELAYVAYVAARANRRSEFVLGPQSRMKDEIVDSLEAALLAATRACRCATRAAPGPRSPWCARSRRCSSAAARGARPPGRRVPRGDGRRGRGAVAAVRIAADPDEGGDGHGQGRRQLALERLRRRAELHALGLAGGDAGGGPRHARPLPAGQGPAPDGGRPRLVVPQPGARTCTRTRPCSRRCRSRGTWCSGAGTSP